MTRQEAYNIVRNHLLTQNAKSMALHNGRNICAYRGEEGRKCAIGVLIPDSRYKPKLEGQRVSAINVWEAAELGPISVEVDGQAESASLFYEQLQEVHDIFPTEHWKIQLDRIAKYFKLEIEAPSETQAR